MRNNFEISEITEPVVGLELVKKHLRIEADYTDEDELILHQIEAAQSAAAEYMQRPLCQKLTMYRNAFQNSFEFEAIPDVYSVNVKYVSDKKKSLELSPENYAWVKTSGNVHTISFTGELPKVFAGEKAITIEVISKVPKVVISAILLRVADLYEKREDRGEVGYNSAFTNLLRPFRRY